jgi:hypothetical protein
MFQHTAGVMLLRSVENAPIFMRFADQLIAHGNNH